MNDWNINKKAGMAVHPSGLKVEMSPKGEAIDLMIPKGMSPGELRRLTLEAEQAWKHTNSHATVSARVAPDPALTRPSEGPRKSTLSLRSRKKVD